MLGVLDGAVLVVSAVEGVQAQTRVLMRALRRLRHPDADLRQQDRPARRRATTRVLRDDRRAADPGDRPDGHRVRASAPRRARSADVRRRAVARLLEAARRARRRAAGRVRRRRRRSRTAGCATALAAQTRQALVHPVFFGSAITGAGVDALIAGITELLPAAAGDADGPVVGHACSRSSAGRPGRRSPTCGCSPARCACATGCRSAADGERQGHRDQRLRPRRGGARRRPSPPGRSASCGAWPTSGSATRSASRGRRAAASLRAADPGDGRRPAPAGRQGRAAGRARPSWPSRTR